MIVRRLSLTFAHEDRPLSGTDDPYPHRQPNIDIDDSDDDLDLDMDPNGPSYGGQADRRSGQPLLGNNDDERGRARYNHSRSPSPLLNTPSSSSQDTPPVLRPTFSRRSTMRSRSPDTQARMAARKKYTYAAIFLIVSLISFCIQTELAAYVQQELGWNKAYCMLYMTHGSWSMLWPVQLLILRIQKWNMPWQTFWRRHVFLLRSTVHMIRSQELDVPRHMVNTSPWPYLIKTTAFITSSLTVAGLSWYVAVNMTTPSDLTAIYNCSAFFAYAFSVPLLKEKLRLDKSMAVLIAIVGVLVVAYGDSKPTDESKGPDKTASTRFLGNLIIGVGSVLYGLYEVLYKRWACPPEGVSAGRGMIFANAFGSCIGLFTLTVLWIPLPILHFLGWETFQLPTGETAFYLWISVVMNATFAGSFLVLISLTSPVLSSVAALLTIFIVAIVDWLRTGQSMSFAAIVGGIMIILAFVMLSWSTYREMVEDAERKAVAGDVDPEWDGDSDSDSDKDGDRLG
jgi:drug/metabolite transporter (DMT)-like permease